MLMLMNMITMNTIMTRRWDNGCSSMKRFTFQIHCECVNAWWLWKLSWTSWWWRWPSLWYWMTSTRKASRAASSGNEGLLTILRQKFFINHHQPQAKSSQNYQNIINTVIIIIMSTGNVDNNIHERWRQWRFQGAGLDQCSCGANCEFLQQTLNVAMIW